MHWFATGFALAVVAGADVEHRQTKDGGWYTEDEFAEEYDDEGDAWVAAPRGSIPPSFYGAEPTDAAQLRDGAPPAAAAFPARSPSASNSPAAGESVRNFVMCNHGEGRATPWVAQKLEGEGEFGEQTLYAFAAVVDPAATTLSVVAFVKDARPRFMWDHMQTSYDTDAILQGVRCEWTDAADGAVTTVASEVHVEMSVDGSDGLLQHWKGSSHPSAGSRTWSADEVPRFSNVAIVTCPVPAGAVPAAGADGAKLAVRLVRRGMMMSGRAGVPVALPVELCSRTRAVAELAVCTQPFRKACTGKCPGTKAERTAGWNAYLAKMRQWIAYGQLVGVTKFYIYDRDGDIDAAPGFAELIASGVVEHVHWPGFSDAWIKLPATFIPKGKWALWDKQLADTARVDPGLSPDRSSEEFSDRVNGLVFNKDPIVFDQVIAINHCFYTNRFSAEWLMSSDPDEYWHVLKDEAKGSLPRLLKTMAPDVAEVLARSVQYGVCPATTAKHAQCTGDVHLEIEKMQCHHPTPEMDEHMKYIARPVLAKVAFIHQVNLMASGSRRHKLAPMTEARFNHYTCGVGHAAEGLFYPGCDLKQHDETLLKWAAPEVRAALGYPACAARGATDGAPGAPAATGGAAATAATDAKSEW